jgi:restriction endonuclease Mrr
VVIPSSMDLQIQILNVLNDQQVHSLSEIKEMITKKFEISSDEKKKLAKNKRPIFDTRIIHSLSMLRKNGEINNQKRANFKITKAGINRLKNV